MNNGKYKILVIEDDAAVNQLLCRRLEREGYEVEGIVSGRALLEYLKSGNQADLMLLDYNLSDFDAAAIIANIKISEM